MEDKNLDLDIYFEGLKKRGYRIHIEWSSLADEARKYLREKRRITKPKEIFKYVDSGLTPYGAKIREYQEEEFEEEYCNKFIPNEDECFDIGFRRMDKFEELIRKYERSKEMSAVNESELIDCTLDDCEYKYLYYYKRGKPIKYSSSAVERQNLIEEFSDDLALFDFVQYLEGRKEVKVNEGEKLSIDEKKIKELVFDDVFISDEKKEIAIKVMIELSIIDESLKCVLPEGKRRIIRSLIEVLQSKMFIHEKLKITPLINCFGDYLGIKKLRINESDSYQKSRVSKALVKYSC